MTTPAFDPRTTVPWRLVADLGVVFGFERSFRLSPGSLLTDRFLLSASFRAIGAAKVRELCAALAMPDHLRAPLERALAETRFLHVGYEAGSETRVYKVYLEQRLPGDTPTAPVLLHEAFKWDAARPGPGVVARYVWHPMNIDGIRERLAAIYGDNRESFSLIASVVDRAGPKAVRYLEVTEEGNPRRSFDLNLYDAGLRVGDIGPELDRLGKRYGVVVDQLAGLYDRDLGHVAGGVHRNGEDFVTVYYGVEAGR